MFKLLLIYTFLIYPLYACCAVIYRRSQDEQNLTSTNRLGCAQDTEPTARVGTRARPAAEGYKKQKGNRDATD